MDLHNIEGGVTAACGYSAAGIHAGIKNADPDLALLVSETPAVMAGVFTSNQVKGAHVHLCQERMAGRQGKAILVNSGNADACNGARGRQDADQMAAWAASALGIDENLAFVCSTGGIGIPLPMDKIREGIPLLVEGLSRDGTTAAKAIMTTDTVEKQAAVELEVNGKVVRIGGMAKGAGMVHPNMATMLAFLATDAAADPGALQQCLASAVDASFNRISVDGDQSCNDTVLCMANGMAGNDPLNPSHEQWPSFCEAVNGLALDLALQIVRDGEGATRVVTIVVKGAASDGDADSVARAIANSLLVKTSWYGADPNWGRVMDVIGYAGAKVDEHAIDLHYDDMVVVRGGAAVEGLVLGELETIVRNSAFTLTADLNGGAGEATIYTCDCSEEYVRINSEYLT